MERLAGVLLLLNLTDGALTWTGISLGVITEANPLLRWGLAAAPGATVAAKVLGVSGLVLCLARARRFHWTIPATSALVLIYLGVIGLHLVWITRVLL